MAEVEKKANSKSPTLLSLDASDNDVEKRNAAVRLYNARPGRFVYFPTDGPAQKARWIAFDDWPQKPTEENSHDKISKNDDCPSDHPGSNWNSDAGETDARFNERPQVAITQVLATSGQDAKPNKRKRVCNGQCWHMDTPGKVSKGQWLIRLRNCRQCGRKVEPVTYIDDSFHNYLMSEEKIYAEFKRQVENGTYSQTFWQAIAASAYFDCNSGS